MQNVVLRSKKSKLPKLGGGGGGGGGLADLSNARKNVPFEMMSSLSKSNNLS